MTLPAYHNVYIYSRSTLWIAYGLAIAFSVVSVLLGLSVMVMNGASFDDSFSTILRVSKTAELMTEFRSEGEDGRLPLPAYLEKARLVMSSQWRGEAAKKHVSVSTSGSSDAKSIGSESSASQLLRREDGSEVVTAYTGR